MSDQTFLYVLIFVFAVIALIALGARSFTRLVELILSHTSKVDQPTPETPPQPTPLLPDKERSTSLLPTDDSPITPDNPSGNSTGIT
jgi:hypothetical protein